jgi:hypothetical protein
MIVNPWRRTAGALVAPFIAYEGRSPFLVVAVWWVTVPLHEMLHALGCVLAGGSVSELTIQPIYGGVALERLFDFVRSGGEYAGRLTGFDTGGNDVTYFVTVAFPYLLTVCLGVWSLERAAQSRSRAWHAVGIVHSMLPVASLTGDYYEMGSIIVTRLIGMSPETPHASILRGDDIVRVLRRVGESDLSYGWVWVAAGFLTGLVLVQITIGLSLVFSALCRGRSKSARSTRRE